MDDVRRVARLPDDFEIRLDLQQTPQAVAKRWMIVRDDNSDGGDGGNHCARPACVLGAETLFMALLWKSE
jgi:hypothetical protein